MRCFMQRASECPRVGFCRSPSGCTPALRASACTGPGTDPCQGAPGAVSVSHTVDARGIAPAILLGHLADRQQLRGSRADEQLLEVLHLPEVAVLCGTEDPFLQSPYSLRRHGPVDAGPRWKGSSNGLFGLHRLTSPLVRVPRSLASAGPPGSLRPFGPGIPASRRPYPSRYRTAFAFSGIFYPRHHPRSLRSGYRREAGCMGLTLLPDGEFDRGGCALWPGGDRRHRRQPKNLAVLPTLRFGSSLTAPLACSL